MTRRIIATLAVTGLLGAAGVIGTSAPTEAASCSTAWGSTTKTAQAYSQSTVRDVRAGRHACYDRLVIDLKGNHALGYRVRYVDQVRADGSGDVVPLRGGAKLEVVAQAPAYDASGGATYRPANRAELVNVGGYRTFRQVAWAGSFEGQTTIGLGVRARLPMRAFTIAEGGTTRLVVDVAHTW